MNRWRIRYKHYHREDSSHQHEDVEAPTAHDAVLEWILDNVGEVESDKPTLGDVSWDEEPRSLAVLDEQGGFSFWAGGSDCDLFSFILVEPCRWATCPLCQGGGEIEVPPKPGEQRTPEEVKQEMDDQAKS